MTVSMLIFGKFGDLFGRRCLLAVAIGIFVLASLLYGPGVALLTSLLWQLLPGFSASSLPEAGGAQPVVAAT
jgi:MFS family permease